MVYRHVGGIPLLQNSFKKMFTRFIVSVDEAAGFAQLGLAAKYEISLSDIQVEIQTQNFTEANKHLERMASCISSAKIALLDDGLRDWLLCEIASAMGRGHHHKRKNTWQPEDSTNR